MKYSRIESISVLITLSISVNKQIDELKDPEVEKTSDKAEHHFSSMSWLFKHRFKTKEGLLKTSYWYHYYLSTGI